MVMTKVKSLDEIAKITGGFKRNGKAVGLITGCFDILHIGHIQLFRFARKHVDIVIVGLDNDESIKRTKGENRPVNTFKRRSEQTLFIKLTSFFQRKNLKIL